MPEPPPRYVLSQRAADALRPVLTAGAGYGSRPRQIRDVGAAARPCLFDLRVDASGAASIYLGGDATLVGPNNAVRVNGRPVSFDVSALTAAGDGWYTLAGSNPNAIWIQFAAPSGAANALDAAENWTGGTGGAAGSPVVATIVAGGASVYDTFPDGRAFHRVLLWYRQLGGGSSWLPNGPWTRCTVGGVDITVDLGDADGGATNVSTGLSIEHTSGDRRLSLYSFTANAVAAPNSSVSQMAFIIRRLPAGGKPYLQYITGATVVRSDSSGKIYVGASDVYAPTQITVGGQTLTVLAKQ